MSIAARTFTGILLCVAGVAGAAGTTSDTTSGTGRAVHIYVAPAGNDQAGGLAPDKALATLGQALKVYGTTCDRQAIEIQVAAGSYSNERNTLKRVPCPLRITGENGSRPRFSGGGNGTWLNLSAPGAGNVDVTIKGLEISDYQTAISVNGNRNSPDAWIGGVRILDNRFSHIGSFREDQSPSTAAVRFVNTRSSVIEGNEFETIRNFKSCGGLHSIYMASMSSNNLIKGNRFIDGCGDAIKVRDASNGNRVIDNQFERQEGNALFLDSYCDKNARGDCTKPEGECPSWDNVFEDNTVRGPRAASNKKIVNTRKIESTLPNCPPPPAGRSRMQERGTRAQ
jgi:hypothetical protein